MAWASATFVVLAFTGDKAAPFREDYINAFDRMEAELRARPTVDPMVALQDPRQLLQLLGVRAQRAIDLEGVVAEQGQALAIANNTIEEQSVTVAAHDRIAEAEGSYTITVTAKHLGVLPGALFDYMRNGSAKVRWLYERRAGSTEDIAIQDRLDADELVEKVSTVKVGRTGEKPRDRKVTRVRVTAMGLTRLARLIVERRDPLLPIPKDALETARIAKGHPLKEPDIFD
ncbi:hypothetical protein BK022_04720 [Methylorubrum extorquens]|uniref:Antirepressor protein C-terminal domain-containing protein n=1 Tax=Methylorubrum extorquens TaxID=408 RepID=A0A1S1P7I7_METEX|nr:hypothetical protein BK022_04720 [Methylorubrum extorquens]